MTELAHTANRACGLLFCFNEEHILAETLAHYLAEGIDLVVFDNESTDSSREIVESFRQSPQRFSGRVLGVETVATDGYEWRSILATACAYMHANLSSYDWILLIDADAFYRAPVASMSLTELMEAVDAHGFNVIDGDLYEFFPTEKDDPAIPSHRERLRYCAHGREQAEVPQHKMFRYHPSVEFAADLGHTCYRDHARLAPVRFLYHHYPWVSYDHGIKKVFNERKPRYVESVDNLGLHVQYGGLLPRHQDLVKHSCDLIAYRDENVLLSQARFERTLASAPLARAGRFLAHGTRRVQDQATLFARAFRYNKRLAVEQAVSFTKGVGARALSTGGGEGATTRERELRSVVMQEPHSCAVPESYHFLMTNFCNVACTFCNQISLKPPKKEITIDTYKTMLAHAPLCGDEDLYFSGGGDPLLCADLAPILEHTHAEYPNAEIKIVTNGILLERLSKKLASLPICKMLFSIHETAPSPDHKIMVYKGSQDVWRGLEVFNEDLKQAGSKMLKEFQVVASRDNIEQLPEIIRRAKKLDACAVRVSFCRYSADQTDGDRSLYYAQGLYDRIIRESRKLARRLGVELTHEPMFSEGFRARPCYQPWTTVVVDWDGQVFPCTGGESWFLGHVKRGEYDFGNLLAEPLLKFWNNDSFVRVRRTCRGDGDEIAPECVRCHNTICFEGPNIETGHVIRDVNDDILGLSAPQPVDAAPAAPADVAVSN
jgi:MoaA/NifB/PqqE/SkfB family radical SAM enzyme/glycosyltransferase involved in cell wall biosynthesis